MHQVSFSHPHFCLTPLNPLVLAVVQSVEMDLYFQHGLLRPILGWMGRLLLIHQWQLVTVFFVVWSILYCWCIYFGAYQFLPIALWTPSIAFAKLVSTILVIWKCIINSKCTFHLVMWRWDYLIFIYSSIYSSYSH